jgi:D-alanine-D-alanine ligase
MGVCDDILSLLAEIQSIKPDLVFNMCEAFKGRRDYEPHIVSLLDLLDIPYTGTKALGLSLCQDKNLSKKILVHHRIRVPKWVVSHFQRPTVSLKKFAFPAFVKPAREEGSEGISRDSFVENEKDGLERVRFLHERFKSDVIVEEFIPGREFYVSALGLRRAQILPIRELCFNEFPPDTPKFATFKAKWDDDYRKKWGIRSEFARPLSEHHLEELRRIAKKCFEVLSLSGFARFDMRVSEEGEIVVLEANPNPSLAPGDDLSQSAQKAGFSYDQMIEKLVEFV